MTRAWAVGVLALALCGWAAACASLGGLSGEGATDGGTSEAATTSDAGADTGVGDAGMEAEAAACGADLVRDPRNCGACGHDCLDGACEKGACGPFTFAHSTNPIDDLACDDTAVYWSTNGTLYRKTVGTGEAPVALTSGGSGSSLAVDATRVYFTAFDGAHLFYVTKTAPNMPGALVTEDAGAFVTFVAAFGDTVYYTSNRGLEAIAKDGGAPSRELTSANNAQRLAADGTGVYYFTFGPEIRFHAGSGSDTMVSSAATEPIQQTNLVADDAGVTWWTKTGSVARFVLATNDVLVLATDVRARSVAVDATKAYAALDDATDAGPPSGSIVSMPKNVGGGALSVEAAAQLHPRSLVACARVLAWVTDDAPPNEAAVVLVAR